MTTTLDDIAEPKEVASIVKRCLSDRGENRPSMKEVAMELESLRIMTEHPQEKVDLYRKKTGYMLTKSARSFSIDIGTSNYSTN